jgi:glyoxylase-like metal-dependent hydrolase (beta-lactamase superfamily II)
MKIHRLISPYRQTNNYLIEISAGKFIGIDIGDIEIDKITKIVSDGNGEILAYFLTHSHADHCIGINKLLEIYKMPIYCSENCGNEIMNARKNLSFYSEEIPTFEYDLPYIPIIDDDLIEIDDYLIRVFLVPGHTTGCATFFLNGVLFTGDFLMLNHKTPLNFPNSNKEKYKDSITKILNLDLTIETIYPGHGESFRSFNEITHLNF